MPVKKSQCPNCGAYLEQDQPKCEYCGTQFKVTKKEPEPQDEFNILDLNKKIATNLTKSIGTTLNYFPYVIMIIFGFIFTAVTIFMAIISFKSGGGAFFILPLLFSIVGITLITAGIVNLVKTYKKNHKDREE